MKKILYFILAVLTIIYIGFLCYANIVPNEPGWIMYISIYGGLAIVLAYAVINFIGSPLKIALLIILIIAVAVLVLTIAVPDFFRDIFKISANAKGFINLI